MCFVDYGIDRLLLSELILKGLVTKFHAVHATQKCITVLRDKTNSPYCRMHEFNQHRHKNVNLRSGLNINV
jgi:hypothetical protein